MPPPGRKTFLSVLVVNLCSTRWFAEEVPNAGFSVTRGASSQLAALIISHFEAVTHSARHLLVFTQTLSFPCRGSLCLSEALIIFRTNRFGKQSGSAEGLLSAAAFVNIK